MPSSDGGMLSFIDGRNGKGSFFFSFQNEQVPVKSRRGDRKAKISE